MISKLNMALVYFLIAALPLFIGNHCSSFGQHGKDSPKLGAKTSPNISDPGPLNKIFGEIAEKTIPTVVSVIPTTIDTVEFFRNPFFFKDTSSATPSDYFFGSPGRAPPVERREYRQQGLGSGVIISSDGYILTNYHVVQGAAEIRVLLSDGRNFYARVIGADSLADVAVIKLNEKVNNLPVAFIGNSDSLKPGDIVVAVGNPFSFTSSVTLGIVSALNRKIEGSEMYQDFIQTDAAINPGNSGGALVNVRGELVGINTMIITPSGAFAGVGFAIPINTAAKDAQDLIRTGTVTRGYIGVNIQDLNESAADALGLKSTRGALVSDVVKGEPADKAGLKRGDVVLTINGKEVESGNGLRNIVASFRPGQTVPLTVMRGGKEVKLKITIAERKSTGTVKPPKQSRQQSEKKEAFLGLELTNLTPEIRQQLNIPQDENGIVVIGVQQSLSDERALLIRGDLIQEIKIRSENFKDINSVEQFRQIVAKLKPDDSVMLLVMRRRETFFVSFKAGS
ncbi:MAG: Do family serine endopeptidase [Fibrobacter sp.]|jgi:serine protease Do|nr:Do family serine endopeptidase [Fibrobacter sp.]